MKGAGEWWNSSGALSEYFLEHKQRSCLEALVMIFSSGSAMSATKNPSRIQKNYWHTERQLNGL